MKELLKKLKTKKVFIIIFIVTLLAFIIGILLVSIESKDNKELITTSLTTFFNNIKENKLNTQTLLYKSITNNLIINIIVWLLGISIIGLPIVLIILGFKSILYTYKLNGLIKVIIYIIPNIINLFVLFVLTYYSINFSLMLFNYLFRKKEYNKKLIVNRYLKLLILSLLISILTSVIETFILPKLFYLT